MARVRSTFESTVPKRVSNKEWGRDGPQANTIVSGLDAVAIVGAAGDYRRCSPISFFVTNCRSRIKVKESLGKVPGKHGTCVVDRLGQLAELPLIDGPTVVRVILPEQD